MRSFCLKVLLDVFRVKQNSNFVTAQPRNSWNSAVASTLQEVELRTLNFDLCQESYQDDDTVKDKMHPDSMVCAGKISGGVDTCNVSRNASNTAKTICYESYI